MDGQLLRPARYFDVSVYHAKISGIHQIANEATSNSQMRMAGPRTTPTRARVIPAGSSIRMATRLWTI